jgi:hypothetical protein
LTNPVEGLRRPKHRTGRDRHLEGPKEEARLLKGCDACGNAVLRPVVLWALETAMWQGEILALKRSDIRGSIARVADSKNGHSRAVALSSRAQALIGLALSGGGVRSASVCLGVLQALAEKDYLRFVDYLSTVSGGGYIGACWSALLARSEDRQAGNQTDFPFVHPERAGAGYKEEDRRRCHEELDDPRLLGGEQLVPRRHRSAPASAAPLPGSWGDPAVDSHPSLNIAGCALVPASHLRQTTCQGRAEPIQTRPRPVARRRTAIENPPCWALSTPQNGAAQSVSRHKADDHTCAGKGWRLAAFLLLGGCDGERTGVAHVVPGSLDPAVGTLDVRDAALVDMAVQGVGDAADVPPTAQRVRIERDRCRITHLRDTGAVEIGALVVRAGVPARTSSPAPHKASSGWHFMIQRRAADTRCRPGSADPRRDLRFP